MRMLVDRKQLRRILHFASIGISEVIENNEIHDTDTDDIMKIKQQKINALLTLLSEVDLLDQMAAIDDFDFRLMRTD